MSYASKRAQFLNSTQPFAFDCIPATNRQMFIKDLEDRQKTPVLIDQAVTMLCGPAAFMYCIAREKPDDYGEYVLDLALSGEGNLGGLHVKPGADCRATPLAGQIHPIDWIALASLRDASNAFADMDDTDDRFAGITTGSDLKAWFNKTGWFPNGVLDASNWVANQSLDNLLEVNVRSPKAYVCLCIRAAIIEPSSGEVGMNKIGKTNAPKTWWGGADHWIVLGDGTGTGTGDNKDILVSPQSAPQRRPYPNMPGNDDLPGGMLEFKFYSWGKIWASVNRFPGLKVEEFLRYYYGFVIASK
jgi:hypothetical protein